MRATTRSSSGSVSPRWATAQTSTPWRRAVSAKSTGKRPEPAMSPTRSTSGAPSCRCGTCAGVRAGDPARTRWRFPIRTKPSAAHSAFGGGHEFRQLGHFGDVPPRVADLREGILHGRRGGSAGAEEGAVGALEGEDRVGVEAAAFQTDEVQAAEAGAVAGGGAERRDV